MLQQFESAKITTQGIDIRLEEIRFDLDSTCRLQAESGFLR